MIMGCGKCQKTSDISYCVLPAVVRFEDPVVCVRAAEKTEFSADYFKWLVANKGCGYCMLCVCESNMCGLCFFISNGCKKWIHSY